MNSKYISLHMGKVQQLLNDFNKRGKKDPLFFYKNDLRTPLFMLQGICRIYREIYDKEVFEQLAASTKIVEDTLGAIDYYDQLLAGIAANKKVNTSVIACLKKERDKKLVLLKKLTVTGNSLQKLLEKYEKADATTQWLAAKKEIKKTGVVYRAECKEVTEFMRSKLNNFKDMELDVHELRRKLRWLSIYTHAFKGLFQLKEPATTKDKYKKYLTPEVLQSKFNQVEPDPALPQHIQLNRNRFLALSYLIAAIGKIKDDGLMVDGLAKALLQTKAANNEQTALKLAGSLLQYPPGQMDKLKQQVNQLSGQFLQDKILNKLIEK